MPKFNKNQVKLKDAYTFYKKSVKNPVSYQEYKLILDTWGRLVVDYLVAGKDIKLHHGLSVIGIRKKDKPTYVDKLESRKQGRLIKKSNAHSGFFGARVFWRRHYTTFSSMGWVFRPTRLLQSKLNAVMSTPGGHRNFLMRATVTRTLEQATSTYNKKVHKI